MLRTGDREVIYRRCSTPRHHHHLVCRECGKTVEVEGPAVVESWAARVAAEHGYSDVSHTAGDLRDLRGPLSWRPLSGTAGEGQH